KGAIKKEATRVGEIALSETIPRLSSSALEFLLQVPRGGDQLWSFSPDNVGNFRILWIANDDELNNIAELDRLGLVTLTMEKDPSKVGADNWQKVHEADVRRFVHDIPE